MFCHYFKGFAVLFDGVGDRLPLGLRKCVTHKCAFPPTLSREIIGHYINIRTGGHHYHQLCSIYYIL